ncbi:MAG: Transcriptional regulator (modular protein) [Promethearchaeota archaeon]|nr:MAG: Transcriptional regulator (modular protein) [Candidatus Lokiarchaeota archaeon]
MNKIDDDEHSKFEGSQTILEKCKLTEEEMGEYLEKTKELDKKVDHSRAYRTLSNPTRRELLIFIGDNVRTFQELRNKFELDEDQLNYHLSMLEQLFYLMNTKSGWKATPRGIGFLENTILGE